MKRREFIALVSTVAAWPVAARAQHSGGVRRIGILLSLAESDPEGKVQLSGFMQGLAELGWVDGRNLQTEIRWGGGDVGRIQSFAKELVALQPDLIVAHGTPVTAALHRETRIIPIVFVTVSDPVGDGFVAGLPHPGGNITGFLTSESAITAKMLELLTEIAPGLKRVALLFNPDTAPGHGAYYLPDFEAAARSRNIEPIAARAHSDGEIEAAVTSLGKEPGGGLIVTPDYFMLNHIRAITFLVARNKVPAIYPWRSVIATDGALFSYGPDLSDNVRRGALYVDRILRGEKAANLPVQVPMKFEMAVNARTAEALGLIVPPSIRMSADEVIE